MFQTHCYDAWLGGTARNSKVYMWSQILGTFPAPLFLFLAGISFALVIDRLLRKNISASEIGKKMVRRGAEILGWGLLFRLQEYVIALGWAPWTDLFRVDILNTIGASMVLMGVTCWLVLKVWGATGVRSRDASLEKRPYTGLITTAVLVTAAICLLTPLLWTIWRPNFLPWELESYIDGVHNLGQPQSWLFPIFPWGGFAFAGLAAGFFLLSDSTKKLGAHTFLMGGILGVLLIFVSRFLVSRSVQIYPVFDYWHTSPEFFILRLGMLLLLMSFAYGWCRWGPGTWAFSPLIQLGQTSLLVYWVHIELVYGRFTILPRRANSILGASVGLFVICVMMLALSLVRTKIGRLTFYKARIRPTHP